MDYPKIRHFGAIMEAQKAEMCSEPLEQELGPTDVMVKMLYCNICTTDYQMWDGRRNNRGYPQAAGHEWSGEVVAIGEKVTHFKIGDRVAACGGGCGECIYCRMGRPEECISAKWHKPPVNGFYGVRCFSDYKVFPQNGLIKMTKDLPAYLTAFLEPVSACVGGWEKMKPEAGATVVVIGAGPMGIINAMVYHAVGCRVIVSEMSDKKIERLKALGWPEIIDSRTCDPVEKVFELTDGFGADCVIPCAAITSVYEQAFKMLKKHDGKMLFFGAGYPEPEMNISPNQLHYMRADLIGTIGCTTAGVVFAAKLINNKLIDIEKAWEGEIYPLRDIQQAYESAVKRDQFRISVDLQGI